MRKNKIEIKAVATYENDYQVIDIIHNGKERVLLDVESPYGLLVDITDSDVVQNGFIKVYPAGDHCGENLFAEDEDTFYKAFIKNSTDDPAYLQEYSNIYYDKNQMSYSYR